MYEDFLNGLAGNNSFGPWTTGGVDGAIWLFDTDGPNGDFSSTTERIQSTTGDNGFMIFDNDFANSGGGTTSFDGYLISPAMDLSATPNVRLVFQSRFRWCCTGNSSHFVDVSTDGGATWPTRLLPNETFEPETNNSGYFGLDQTNVVNLGPSIASDPSNVKIRIVHNGATGNSHYHWQVDDVAIVESPQNDIKALHFAFDNYVGAELTENLEFSVYPMNHLREFTMKAVFVNEGANDATDVTFNAEVYDSGMNSIWTGSAVLPLLPAGAMDSIEIIPGFTPPSIADTYTTMYSLTSNEGDDIPGDTEGMGSFAVSDYTYALDDGERDGEYDNQGEAYQIGNLIYIVNDDEITGIQVAVATGSTVGTSIAGILLDGNLDPVDFTDDYEITSSDLTNNGGANWIDLLFASPVAVTAGEEYLVGFEHFGGTDNVEIATSGASLPQTSFIYDQPIDTWFYLTNTPMVRANFDPSLGISDAEMVDGVGLGQNYPNPFSNSTLIPYSIEEAADVSIEVYDVTGKLVHWQNEGRRGAGQYQADVDASTFDSGVYYYTLVANNVRITKKMTILK